MIPFPSVELGLIIVLFWLICTFVLGVKEIKQEEEMISKILGINLT
jgi:hypothetical protein